MLKNYYDFNAYVDEKLKYHCISSKFNTIKKGDIITLDVCPSPEHKKIIEGKVIRKYGLSHIVLDYVYLQEEYPFESTFNGYCFKDYDAFDRKVGVCYIPENELDKYTYNDFLKLCEGNHHRAEILFDLVDWQHPESLLYELDWGEE